MNLVWLCCVFGLYMCVD